LVVGDVVGDGVRLVQAHLLVLGLEGRHVSVALVGRAQLDNLEVEATVGGGDTALVGAGALWKRVESLFT
jgi:hypothetical protein